MVTPRQPESLYSEKRIADRIEDERRRRDITVKAAAEIIGLSESAWYKKADGTNPFTVREVGVFAARIGAPLGWPFIEWSAAAFLLRELPPSR